LNKKTKSPESINTEKIDSRTHFIFIRKQCQLLNLKLTSNSGLTRAQDWGYVTQEGPSSWQEISTGLGKFRHVFNGTEFNTRAQDWGIWHTRRTFPVPLPSFQKTIWCTWSYLVDMALTAQYHQERKRKLTRNQSSILCTYRNSKKLNFFIIGNLHMRLMSLETTTSTSNLFL